jgi:hypothetical protein
MSYKVTISDGTILEGCIEHVSFCTETTNDYNSRHTSPRNSMIITGKIDTEEKTASLYKWALLSGTNPDCYKEITVEQYQKELLVRKVTFSKAFVIDYSESYSNYSGVGTFTLYVRQIINKEIDVTSAEINKPVNDTVQEVAEKADNRVEIVQKVAEVTTPVLALTKKNPKITEKLAERKEAVVKYGEQYTRKDRKKVLKPNIQYTTPEGYTYKTDELGRITSAEGTLQLGDGKRNADAQRKVGREDRKKDDDGGHLIASIFKGSITVSGWVIPPAHMSVQILSILFLTSPVIICTYSPCKYIYITFLTLIITINYIILVKK